MNRSITLILAILLVLQLLEVANVQTIRSVRATASKEYYYYSEEGEEIPPVAPATTAATATNTGGKSSASAKTGAGTATAAASVDAASGTSSGYYYYYDEESEEAAPADTKAAQQQHPAPAKAKEPEPSRADLYGLDDGSASSGGFGGHGSGMPPPVPPGKYGFSLNIRGRPVISSGQVMTPTFLNRTVNEFDCVLRRDYGTKRDMLSPADLAALEAARNIQSHGVADPNSDEEIINRILNQHQQSLMDEEEAEAAAAAVKAVEDAAAASDKAVKKRLSFREKEMMKMEARKAEYARSRRAIPLYRMGPTCEDRICYSCRIVVEEFGLAVLRAVRDPKYRYIMDVADDGFCNSRDIYLKYKEQVYDMCNIIVKANKDYKDFLVASFEEEDLKVVDATTKPLPGTKDKYAHYWDYLSKNIAAQTAFLHERKRNVCIALGACSSSDFEIATTAVYRQQEFWNETCFVCQAVVRDMETRVVLEKGVTESKATSIVGQTCAKMGLVPVGSTGTSLTNLDIERAAAEGNINAPPPPPPLSAEAAAAQLATQTAHHDLCRNLTTDRLMDDLGWILKVHLEGVEKRLRSDSQFADKACNEVKFCEKWLEPDVVKKKELEKKVEAVYS